MSQSDVGKRFPKWWLQRIEQSLADYNPRLILSSEDLLIEQAERAEREIERLMTDTSRLHAPPESLQMHERINAQVDKQRDLLKEFLVTVFQIEELNNRIVYDLGGHLLLQVQGGIVGEVRVRTTARVRHMQQQRSALEQKALQMWEQIGEGYRES